MSYNSTTWQTGDIVTADKLNNIEQQLIMLDAAQSGGTEVVIDNTLTQTGQAADAKKTGDEISAIKADLFVLPSGGEAGQALVSDGNGGASWSTIQGGSDLPNGDEVSY